MNRQEMMDRVDVLVAKFKELSEARLKTSNLKELKEIIEEARILNGEITDMLKQVNVKRRVKLND